jgi:hypothetical protein
MIKIFSIMLAVSGIYYMKSMAQKGLRNPKTHYQ